LINGDVEIDDKERRPERLNSDEEGAMVWD
jgi:hypothetical protein